MFKKLRQKYKEVVYLLTGWKVDMGSSGDVHLQSMYAEREADKLQFKLTEAGEMQLCATAYSQQLMKGGSDAIVVLNTMHSYPGFLSQLTLDLLDKTTMM